MIQSPSDQKERFARRRPFLILLAPRIEIGLTTLPCVGTAETATELGPDLRDRSLRSAQPRSNPFGGGGLPPTFRTEQKSSLYSPSPFPPLSSLLYFESTRRDKLRGGSGGGRADPICGVRPIVTLGGSEHYVRAQKVVGHGKRWGC